MPHKVKHDEKSGTLLLYYRIKGGSVVEVGMKYEVVSVRQLFRGAKVELL